MNLLDSETIARAEALGLNARYVVEGYMAGEHRSPYHGFAVEFAQHREYTPGDDTPVSYTHLTLPTILLV